MILKELKQGIKQCNALFYCLNPKLSLENLVRTYLDSNQSLRFVLLLHHNDPMTQSQNLLIYCDL